jgi:hypothetical protein
MALVTGHSESFSSALKVQNFPCSCLFCQWKQILTKPRQLSLFGKGTVLEQKSKKRKSSWHAASGVPANSPDPSPRAPLAQFQKEQLSVCPYSPIL